VRPVCGDGRVIYCIRRPFYDLADRSAVFADRSAVMADVSTMFADGSSVL
jgi:hypothetical protein